MKSQSAGQVHITFIDTGHYEQERYHEYARRTAERFDLRYEEIPGSTALIKKMLYGPWDDDFVIARPGDIISYADFKMTATVTSNLPGLSVAAPETG